MKTLIAILSVVLFTAPQFNSDDCNVYLPSQVGNTWEHTNYNAKGKAESTSSSELLSMKEVGNQVIYEFKSSAADKKGKEVFEMTLEATCTDGVYEVDMQSFLDPSIFEQYQNSDITIDNTKLEFPDFDAAVGTELKDSNMTMSMNLEGLGEMNITVDLINRKLAAKESLTVPAGTFDCIVVTQDFEMKILGITTKSSSKDWYAVGVGMIKSETYNKNGKLKSYSELTKLTR